MAVWTQVCQVLGVDANQFESELPSPERQVEVPAAQAGLLGNVLFDTLLDVRGDPFRTVRIVLGASRRDADE
jgi:hypothetical protein